MSGSSRLRLHDAIGETRRDKNRNQEVPHGRLVSEFVPCSQFAVERKQPFSFQRFQGPTIRPGCQLQQSREVFLLSSPSLGLHPTNVLRHC